MIIINYYDDFYFSLKNSLSQEESLKHQFNTTLNDFEARLQEKDRELALAQNSYDDLAAKLNTVTSEKSSLLNQLNDARASLKEKEKRADR